MLNKESKTRIVDDNRIHSTDTGSTEVQVALLSEKIRVLTDHMTKSKKDHTSKTGLLKFVGQRKRLLSYLKREDPSRYETLIKKLGLRK
ncbi:MAG: 30S ribosomal protein S15 [Candidatus Aminicenantes bacterium]|nr:30S ribosomal protein S15 [Candidatus Aminicenantes bacterium]